MYGLFVEGTMEQDILRTNKKECPKCSSKNVRHLGKGGGTRAVKEGESAPRDYHDFECDECGARFKYYGTL